MTASPGAAYVARVLDPPPAAPSPPQPVMAPQAYYGIAADIVRIIEPHTEADPVALLVSLLAMAGNAIGRRPYFRVEGDRHRANLFALLVGDTAKARKGTSAGRIRELLDHADPDWAGKCIHGGLSSGEGLIWAVRDPITKRGAGGQEEITDPGTADKRLMLIESEFAGALAVMERYGNTLSRVLRDAWDRGDLAALTKTSPARATGAHISIVGHITAPELRERLRRTEIANGFANRFLVATVRRSKLLPHGGALPEAEIARMGLRLRHAIDRARNIGAVAMSGDALAAWGAAYPVLTGDRPGIVGALTARAEAHAIRLALVYALLDGGDVIRPDHLAAAVAVTEFSIDSARYIYGEASGNPVADTIWSALRAAGPAGMSRTDITNTLGRHAKTDAIVLALDELARSGRAVSRTASTPGRSAEIWTATETAP